VYAVDVDRSLLAELDALATEQGIDNITAIIKGTLGRSELLPEPVDFALLANAFHGIEDRTAFVEAVAAALAVDGRFAVVNWRDRPREETMIGGEP